MLEHLSNVSIFETSLTALVLLLAFDWIFTLIHVRQEWKGNGAPLWRNFGAICGVCVPDWLGFGLFTLGLTAILWFVGLVAITGRIPVHGNVAMCWTIVALGGLIGGRVADTLFSHWALYSLGFRPNPGIKSTPLYVAEALFLAVTFSKGLFSYPKAAWSGFSIGVLFFAVGVPGLLLLLRALRPSLRRSRWIRGMPMPEWALRSCTRGSSESPLPRV